MTDIRHNPYKICLFVPASSSVTNPSGEEVKEEYVADMDEVQKSNIIVVGNRLIDN